MLQAFIIDSKVINVICATWYLGFFNIWAPIKTQFLPEIFYNINKVLFSGPSYDLTTVPAAAGSCRVFMYV